MELRGRRMPHDRGGQNGAAFCTAVSRIRQSNVLYSVDGPSLGAQYPHIRLSISCPPVARRSRGPSASSAVAVGGEGRLRVHLDLDGAAACREMGSG
eukprot:6200384-Pleurochrysis_carterae.AAC.13